MILDSLKKNFSPILIVGGEVGKRENKASQLAGFDFSQATNSPDFFYLNSTGSIGIEEVRKLQSSISRKPHSEPNITVFIKEAQNLTPEAQNALLKTLEEPPGNCLILLTAPDPSWLLPTFVSRCQITSLPVKVEKFEKEEAEKLKNFIEKIFSSSIPQRLALLEKEGIAKDRETAVLTTGKLILVARELMIFTQNPKYFFLIKLLERTKNQLVLNCNVRLALEVFLLDLTPSN